VQGRDVEVTDSIKSYVQEKVGKAVKHFEGAVKEVDVALSVSGGDRGHGPQRQKTEITVYTLRNGVIRAEDVEDNMYASIDLVCDRLQRRMRKVKEKAIQKGKWAGKGGPKGGQKIDDVVDEFEVVDSRPLNQQFSQQAQAQTPMPQEVVRTKYFFLKPMTVEAALEQCDQLGHDFFVFREHSSDQVQVVYKRKQGGYGVIIPEKEENGGNGAV
jgi:ribosomal subunit interface protein